VTLDENSKQVVFKHGNKVVARHNCQFVEESSRNDVNRVRYSSKDNKQQVQEIRLGGEKRSIVLTEAGT